MSGNIKEEVFHIGRALIAMAQADGEVSRGELGLVENIMLGLDEQGESTYAIKMKEELNRKQTLKDILPLITSKPGKALLLYQICLLVFADNKVDPKELEGIDEVFAMIEFDANLKQKAKEFVVAGQNLVEAFQEAV